MRCNVRYSPAFLDDLMRIEEYIKTQFHDPDAAARVTDGILDATEALAGCPESGARVFLPGGLDSGYRFVIYKGWLAVYTLRSGEVCVARAVHEKQDYMRVLFPWLKNGGEDA